MTEQLEDDRGPNDRYEMFTRAGNDALAAGVSALIGRMQRGEVTRPQLPAAVVALCDELEHTHSEVWDTEPQWAISDEVTAACNELGWAPLSRWDWDC